MTPSTIGYWTTSSASIGPREQKRRATYQRIADTALRLFLAHGYEMTTLEMIVEEAGIARRTFFAYFKTKDEILLAWNRNNWNVLLEELRKVSPDVSPLEAVRNTFDASATISDEAHLRAVVKLMQASPVLLATSHTSFAERELALFQVLCEVWRQPDQRWSLRLAAMMAVGCLRVAVEAWLKEDNRQPLRTLLRQAFDGLGSVELPGSA